MWHPHSEKNGNADAQLLTINCSLLTINCSLDVVKQHVDDGGDVADVEAAVAVQVG